MSEKLDLDIDVAQLVTAPSEVLASLRVGQRLTAVYKGEGEDTCLCTEPGVQLAPLPEPQLAARFPNPKIIIRAIKRDPQSGVIQKLQVRVYRAEDTGTPSDSARAVAAAGPGAPAPDHAQASSAAVEDEHDYKLRRSQYQALADNGELRAMLADPHLQAVLAKIDAAPDRERALAAQIEMPSFQGFVSQVLLSLDPGRVPATAATVAAVAMATQP